MTASFVFERLDTWAASWSEWMLAMSWQFALLVLVLSVLTWLLRRRSAVVLHALWLLVLVRLVVPPGFTLPTGWGWWVLPENEKVESPLASLPAESSTTSEDTAGRTLPAIVDSNQGEGLPLVGGPKKDDSGVEAVAEGSPSDSARRSSSESGSVEAPAPARLATYLMLAWFGVSATLLGMLLVGTVRVARWVYDAEPIDDVELYRLVEGCRRQVGISRLIELRNSDSCTTPVVVGFARPVILLPRAVLTGLSRDELRAVLLHELQHVARGDALVNLLQGVLGAVYFFHPLVWWANARLRELREEACDELTVAALDGERRVYGEAIVKVTAIFGYASPPLAIGVMESKNPARRRLSRILDPQLPRGARLGWQSLAGIVAFAAIVLPSAGARTVHREAAEAPRREVNQPQSVESAKSPVADSNAATDTDTAVPSVEAASSAPATPESEVENDANFGLPALSVPATTEVASAPSSPPATEAAKSEPPASRPAEQDGPTEPVKVRYQWKAGEACAFSVKIEADLGDEVEILSGVPTYQVRSNDQEAAEITFVGRLVSARRIKQVRPFRGPPRFTSPFSPFGGVGFPGFPAEHTMRIDDRGNFQSVRGDSQLPWLLGNLSQLLIDVYPEKPSVTWEESDKTAITLFETDERFPMRPRFGPIGRRDEGERLDARVQTQYRVEGRQGSLVTIARHYELKTLQTVDGKPRLELSGDTQIRFDVEEGLPRSLDGKLAMTSNTTNTSHRIPIGLTARRMSKDELAKLRADQEEAARKAAEKHPLDDRALDAALAELKSPEPFKVQNAARTLEKALPVAREAEVSKALEELLSSPESFVRQEAARALVTWCTKENVPALIKALDDEFFTVPMSALLALGKLRDERGVEPVLRLVRANRHRTQASQALREIGAAAEKGVVGLLDEADWGIRLDACKVLKDIGTQASIARLEEVARGDENGLVRSTAQKSVAEIRSRQGK